MSGLVASRRADSWWRRMALVTWMLVGGQVAAGAVDITTFNSTNVPLNIPSTTGTVGGDTESVVVVSGIRTAITTVTVSLFIDHRWPADLRITLVPPGGGAGVILLNPGQVRSDQIQNPTTDPDQFAPFSNRLSFNTGIGTSNLPAGRVVFADPPAGVAIDPDNTDHVNNIENHVHLLPGTYDPVGFLGTFSGLTPAQANGTWKLVIEDIVEELDSGRLIGWSLTITEPGPHIWTGEGATADWSDEDNWAGGNEPTPGEPSSLLIFPADAAGPSNNDIGEIRVVTMTVEGAYSFTADPGCSITLITGSTLTVNSPTVVDLDMPIALVGQPTITAAGLGGLNLPGVISDDGAAAGMILVASGPLTISGANTYDGVTAINTGVIDVTTSNNALGDGAGGTTIATGATLRVAAGLTMPTETISIQGTGVGGIGSLVFLGNATINGLTLVANMPSAISVLGGGAVTVSNLTPAAAVAFHSLSISNTGTITFATDAFPTNTALALDGGLATFGADQPNLSSLALRNGADLDVGAFTTTVRGDISVGASATNSTISGTALSLGGGSRTITVTGGAAGTGFETSGASDLLISATITNGSFTKRSGGVLRMTGTNTGVGVTVNGGALAASGAIGSVNVSNGVLAIAGTLTVGTAVNLADGTGLVLQQGVTPVINAATVSLGGVAGVGGAVLQPYSGQGTTIINTTGAVTGTFDGKPNGAGITYDFVAPGSVTLAASGGRTMGFTPAGPFAVEEDAGTLDVTVTASSGGTAPVLRVFGGLIEGRDLSLLGLAPAGTYVFTIPIVDNYVDTGDLVGTLAIVPQDGSLVTNSARVSIDDNDTSDTKTCGFGTGLTVFLLLGFGLLLHVRLRRP